MEQVQVRKEYVDAPLVIIFLLSPDIRHVQANEDATVSGRTDIPRKLQLSVIPRCSTSVLLLMGIWGNCSKPSGVQVQVCVLQVFVERAGRLGIPYGRGISTRVVVILFPRVEIRTVFREVGHQRVLDGHRE